MSIGFRTGSALQGMDDYDSEYGPLQPMNYDGIAMFAGAAPANALSGWDEGRSRDSGEVALMRAVLADAFKCFYQAAGKNTRRARRLAKEAEDWFFSDDANWPFSFVNICAALRLEPGYLRRKLLLWLQQSPYGPSRPWRHRVPRQRHYKLAA